MYFTLGEWEEAAGGEILAGDPDIFVGGENPGGLSIDSRSIELGQWFIALKGKTGADGHKYLVDAVEKGACGVIVSDRGAYESLGMPDLPALLVKNTILALGDAAYSLLEKFAPFVIAITGTVGKTSVKENVAHIASTRWPVLKSPHNWNTEIGLPLTVFDITPAHRVAVLECASRGAGQISYLSKIARPHLAVITAIGAGHLSEFGSIDAVAEAKWEIVDGLRDNGVVITPREIIFNEMFGGDYQMVTFGTSSTSMVHQTNALTDPLAIRCSISTPVGTFDTEIPGTSRADLLNALCATACAQQIKIETPDGIESLTLEEIADAIRTLPKIPGRLESIVRLSGIEVIFDAYNSNPMSLKNALEDLSVRNILSDGSPIQRRVAILGDMLELGKDEKEYHREAGRLLGHLPIDCLITVGKLAACIRSEVEEIPGRKIVGTHYESTDECAAELSEWLKPGDLVLIKASRNLGFERLLEGQW